MRARMGEGRFRAKAREESQLNVQALRPPEARGTRAALVQGVAQRDRALLPCDQKNNFETDGMTFH